MAFMFGGGEPAPTPPRPPAPPPPMITNPKPMRKKSEVPTFLGSEKTPEAGIGGMERGKTLLGQ